MARISKVSARQVLDSRANPTVQCELTTPEGTFCAIVPSGASTGEHEALELRDKGRKFGGKGVSRAVANVNSIITKKISGQKKLRNLIVIAPDVGSTKRARKYAKILGTDLAIIDKRRPKPNESEVVNLIGDVNGKVCVIVDDEINTGGTIVNATQAAVKNGAKEVYVMASHGVFAGDALEKIDKSPIKEVIVTNSLPLTGKSGRKLKVISVAHLIGEAIRCMHENKSLAQILKS